MQFGGGNKKKWDTLEHNGVLFPAPYVKHDTPLIYDGKEIVLDEESEEIATMFAKYIDTEYVTNKTFRSNFWSDWKKILKGKYGIESLDKCDFSLIKQYLDKQKEEKKKEKEQTKEEKESEEKKYKTAMVNGKEEPVGNFRIEIPGIFIGRGDNPKLGKIKKRVIPEDITINIGKESKIPEIPEQYKGHKWGDVIHDKNSEWLASWRDNITGKIKYVWLGAHSEIRAKGDIEKFEKARKLKRKIKQIMEDNYKKLSSENITERQVSTALYLIDKLLIRVGNEKGDDETDTVGITSLRVEHIDLKDNNKITLDFLGKDSVRYLNTVEVDRNVYQNLKEFIDGKNKYDDIFDKITANDINKYLQSFMKGLTAKVFRTYHASNLFQKELKKITKKYESYDNLDKVNVLLTEFNTANAKIAMLCNHQKNVSKSFKETLDKMDEQIKNVKKKLGQAKRAKKKNPEKIAKIKEKIKQMKLKKQLKSQLKNISLGTSKVNYIDPRITVAFMKSHNMGVDKVFSKTLQEKFKWAFDVDKDYKF
uniref:DNA topoisomerase 1 n=1 Tax=viral metagenome TaxID=1070528 RepID=A0A6C0EAB7_9ZZZZ